MVRGVPWGACDRDASLIYDVGLCSLACHQEWDSVLNGVETSHLFGLVKEEGGSMKPGWVGGVDEE